MKKTFTNLRTLLLGLAAMMATGTAWADATVIYGRALTADVGNGYTAWSSADIATSGENVWIGNFAFNETYGLYAQGNGNRSSVMTFAHTDNSIQTIDIVFNNLSNTGNANNYSYLKIGSDIEIQSNQQNQNGAVIINGNSQAISNCNQKNYNRGGDLWTIHVEINTATKTVTALTLVGTEMNGKSASYTLSGEADLSSSATFNTVTIGFNRASGTPSTALSSIKIAEEEQAVTVASYTINYNFGNVPMKIENNSSAVGATIFAELPITVEGQKYYAADDATTSMVLADGTNVLNVNLRKANEYTYSIANNFGTNIASGTYVEGEPAINAYWNKFVKDGDSWYICDESTFGVSITGALTKTVNYSTVASYNYVFECENLNVSRSPAASDTGNGYSNGVMVRHYSNSYWYTDALEGGLYDLYIPYKNNNSSETTINIYLRDGDGNLTDTGLSVTGEKQSSGMLEASGIVIPFGSALVLYNTNAWNSNVLMDYVALQKMGVPVVPVEVTSAGWATLFTDKALDFSGTGLTAYTATLSSETVTLTEVTTVPAGTGVVLKGEANTYSIPVIASSETGKGSLTGSATDATIADGTQYILVMNDDNNAQFTKANSGNSIAAGKAFLVVPSSVRNLNVVFAGEATGIKAAKTAEEDGSIYNLKGQRMAQPQKGLYIVNGKKAIIK